MIFACVLQDCESRKVAFSCFLLFFFFVCFFVGFFFFKTFVPLELCPPILPMQCVEGEADTVGPKPSGSAEMYSSVGPL